MVNAAGIWGNEKHSYLFITSVDASSTSKIFNTKIFQNHKEL